MAKITEELQKYLKMDSTASLKMSVWAYHEGVTVPATNSMWLSPADEDLETDDEGNPNEDSRWMLFDRSVRETLESVYVEIPAPSIEEIVTLFDEVYVWGMPGRPVASPRYTVICGTTGGREYSIVLPSGYKATADDFLLLLVDAFRDGGIDFEA